MFTEALRSFMYDSWFSVFLSDYVPNILLGSCFVGFFVFFLVMIFTKSGRDYMNCTASGGCHKCKPWRFPKPKNKKGYFMFFGRQRARIEVVEAIVKVALNFINNEIVDCEVCGCMITKKNAVKGEKEIRMSYTEGASKGFFHDIPIKDSEYLYTPYYCKRCEKDRQKKKTK